MIRVQKPPYAWLTHSSKSSDSTCNCSGDGQSICSEPSIDIEYIPPPPTESNVTTENDVDNVNTENDVDNIKTVTVVVEREESTKVIWGIGSVILLSVIK